MSQYFSKPFRNFGGNINVKVKSSNYATKTDLKNISHVDTSSFAMMNRSNKSAGWNGKLDLEV